MAGLVTMDVLTRLLDDTAPSAEALVSWAPMSPWTCCSPPAGRSDICHGATRRRRGPIDGSNPGSRSGRAPFSRTGMRAASMRLTHVVFSRAEDASQRLYYYVRELRSRGLLRRSRAARFRLRIHPARHQPCAHGSRGARGRGQSGRLREGSRSRHRTRQRVAPQASPSCRRVARAGRFLRERGARCVVLGSIGLARRPAVADRPVAPGARVLLAGSVPPDDRLHLAVEAGAPRWSPSSTCIR